MNTENSMTPETPSDASGHMRYVFGCTIVAALGGLLFGFDTAVISGAEKTLQKLWHLEGFMHGFTVATALIGTIVGAMMAGKPADLFGRRKALFVLAGLYLISAVGSAQAWDWWSFVIFRFIGGLGVGGSSVVAPMYVAEISPAKRRGLLVAIVQFNIVLGILLAYLSNFIIGSLNLGDVEWRWMFGMEALPAVLFLLLLFAVPRSPRWLVARDIIDEARKVLGKIGTDTGDIDTEINEIQKSLEAEKQALREPFFQKKYSKPIMLAIVIAMFNQLSGINAVFYYGPRIFEMAGAKGDSALLCGVALGAINLVFTLIAMAIIDSFGRKKLMLVCSFGYIASLSVVAGTFYAYGNEFDSTGAVIVLVGLLTFIASHAIGQGSVIWVFISEIFPNRVRARGQGLGSFTHWFMAAAISWTFPFIAGISGGHAFAFYCGMMVLQLIWVLFVMPETKGIPLEKIQKELHIE